MGPNVIPEPFVWDESFCVFFAQLDEEHKGLFTGIFDCCADNSAENLDALKTKVKAHFTSEEGELQRIDGYDVSSHKKKHDDFLDKLLPATAPLDDATVTFAKDWLVNHIKITDFTYKGKL